MKIWIGLNNINLEQSFNTWVDGYTVIYTNWAEDYPMDKLGVENCVASKNGMWVNMPCETMNAFVCKKKAY